MTTQIRYWQFTIADFARMLEVGIFTEDDRVELIDGRVRAMVSISPRHGAVVRRLTEPLILQFSDRIIVSVHNPVQLNDYNETLPDIAVLRYREDYYRYSHPTPEDVLLVVEVADSSVEYNRDEKVPRYAQAMIPEVWLMDAEREVVIQYAEPDGTGYRHEQVLERGQVIVSVAVSDLRLSVDSVFG